MQALPEILLSFEGETVVHRIYLLLKTSVWCTKMLHCCVLELFCPKCDNHKEVERLSFIYIVGGRKDLHQ